MAQQITHLLGLLAPTHTQLPSLALALLTLQRASPATRQLLWKQCARRCITSCAACAAAMHAPLTRQRKRPKACPFEAHWSHGAALSWRQRALARLTLPWQAPAIRSALEILATTSPLRLLPISAAGWPAAGAARGGVRPLHSARLALSCVLSVVALPAQHQRAASRCPWAPALTASRE